MAAPSFAALGADRAAKFDRFVGTLQNYYDANYYVDWSRVYANAGRFERELALLSTLCNKPDKVRAARALLRDFPGVIRALPILIGCRDAVTFCGAHGPDAPVSSQVTTYDFAPLGTQYSDEEAERYTQFLLASGLIELLERITSVPDYVTGVEVGMDTNGRKNRSGECASNVVAPLVARALVALPGVQVKREASAAYLCAQGCSLPAVMNEVVWDWAFWVGTGNERRFVVMELNHYGTSGSKPLKTAVEYIARQPVLDAAGIGYVWITDGLGWLKMRPTLRRAFDGVSHLLSIRLAQDGGLEAALRELLSAPQVLSAASKV